MIETVLRSMNNDVREMPTFKSIHCFSFTEYLRWLYCDQICKVWLISIKFIYVYDIFEVVSQRHLSKGGPRSLMYF